MHIKVDKTGKIKDIHIERWDRAAMPKELEEQALSFEGKPEKDFLTFAFLNKLFLYTKMLYSSRDENPPLWLWANSALGSGEDGKAVEDIIGRLFASLKPKYATFTYKSDEVRPHTKMLASEDFTKNVFQSNGLDFELIEVPSQPVPMKQMFSLFGLFNITRNGRNDVDYYDSSIRELIRSTASNHGYIVGLSKDGKLSAFSAVDVVIAPREELKDFVAFRATEPRDEKQANAISAAMKFISDVAREVKLDEKGGLPNGIDKEALKLASQKCIEDLVRLDDLPDFLKNLLANIYYQSAILALKKDKKDYSQDGIKKYFSNMSHVVTAVDSIPKFAEVLRSIKNKKEYDEIAHNIFYELKYDVSAGKMSAFKKSLLKFRKPAIEEIKELHLYF